MQGVVGAGGEKPPATRFDQNLKCGTNIGSNSALFLISTIPQSGIFMHISGTRILEAHSTYSSPLGDRMSYRAESLKTPDQLAPHQRPRNFRFTLWKQLTNFIRHQATL